MVYEPPTYLTTEDTNNVCSLFTKDFCYLQAKRTYNNIMTDYDIFVSTIFYMPITITHYTCRYAVFIKPLTLIVLSLLALMIL